jgi:hypothetical protein
LISPSKIFGSMFDAVGGNAAGGELVVSFMVIPSIVVTSMAASSMAALSMETPLIVMSKYGYSTAFTMTPPPLRIELAEQSDGLAQHAGGVRVPTHPVQEGPKISQSIALPHHAIVRADWGIDWSIGHLTIGCGIDMLVAQLDTALKHHLSPVKV